MKDIDLLKIDLGVFLTFYGKFGFWLIGSSKALINNYLTTVHGRGLLHAGKSKYAQVPQFTLKFTSINYESKMYYVKCLGPYA